MSVNTRDICSAQCFGVEGESGSAAFRGVVAESGSCGEAQIPALVG